MRALGPVAEDRARVAGIDDLLDPEALGGAERRAHGVEALLDLFAQRGRVGGGLELALVGGLDPALHRQGAPVARRPRVAEVEPRMVAVAGTGDAEDLANEDRHPRHARLVAGVEG